MPGTETDAPNPYAASTVGPPDELEQAPGVNADSARAVFLAWERLRLVYNAVLTCDVLALGMTPMIDLTDVSIWPDLVAGAVLANVCFCAGPVLEGYIALLGVRRRSVRWLLFVIGTAFACFLSGLAIAFWDTQDAL